MAGASGRFRKRKRTPSSCPEASWRPLRWPANEGKIRYCGFTGHLNPKLHLRVLAHNYPFDRSRCRSRCSTPHEERFPEAGVAGTPQARDCSFGDENPCGNGQSVKDGAITAEEALRYSLSLPITTLISGIDSVEYLRQNAAVAANFKPYTPGRKRSAGKTVRGQGPVRDLPAFRLPRRSHLVHDDGLTAFAGLVPAERVEFEKPPAISVKFAGKYFPPLRPHMTVSIKPPTGRKNVPMAGVSRRRNRPGQVAADGTCQKRSERFSFPPPQLRLYEPHGCDCLHVSTMASPPV